MMNDPSNGVPSRGDLERRWARCLAASEKAIGQRYRLYCDLKDLVKKINAGLVDVAAYYPTAVELGTRLSAMASGDPPTVFYYFAEQIDPRRKGDVRCFRMECRQLALQLEELDRRRIGRRPLRVIK